MGILKMFLCNHNFKATKWNRGEYSYENLTFKLLRRNGDIERLLKLKSTITDKKLSITQ